jgi:hypothetical protein
VARASGEPTITASAPQAMATTGYTELKEFQRIEVVVPD